MQRIQLNNQQINDAIKVILNKLEFRLNQKGYGTFASRHEILGIITEEYNEFIEAVHSKNYDEMESELIDIAVGSIFGVVCLKEKTIDF